MILPALLVIFASTLASCKTPPVVPVPSPVIAITYHSALTKGAANIYLYNMAGYPVGGDNAHPAYLMDPSLTVPNRLDEIRGLISDGGQSVWFANGRTSASRILRYDHMCTVNKTIPNQLGTLSLVTDSNLNHPYDITSHNGLTYVSNQNPPGNIVVFNTSQPSPIVSVYVEITGPRGFAFDSHGRLWVCSDEGNAIVVFSNASSSPQIVQQWVIIAPIAIRFDKVRDRMLITNNDKWDTKVYIFNAATFELVKAVGHASLSHGSGIVSHQNLWFVLSRNTNTLFSLDIEANELTVLNANLLKYPEQLFVLTC